MEAIENEMTRQEVLTEELTFEDDELKLKGNRTLLE